MTKANYVILSVLQVLSCIVTQFAFFAFVPWLGAHPIEQLAFYESAPEPPPDAMSFTVGHGQFTFFADSPGTNKLKALGEIAFLVTNWLFLVLSALYSTKVVEGRTWKQVLIAPWCKRFG